MTERTTMHLHTVHATVPAPRDTVFLFLADIENLPRWTSGFCEWLELLRDGWRAYTALGELDVSASAGDRPGEFELRFGAPRDGAVAFSFRVRSDGEEGAVVSFTCGDGGGWGERPREVLVEALVDGLRGLGTVLRAERRVDVPEPVAG